MRLLLAALAAVTLQSQITQSAIADSSQMDCSWLELRGDYRCNVQGNPIELEIEQGGNRVTVAFKFDDGTQERDVFIGDGVRRPYTDSPGRIGEYIAWCDQRRMVIEDYRGAQRVNTVELRKVHQALILSVSAKQLRFRCKLVDPDEVR